MRRIRDDELTWRGAVSLRRGPDGVSPWRVPHHEARLYFPTGGVGRGAMPAGVRIAFRTTPSRLRVHYRADPPPVLNGPPEVSRADLEVDGELVATRDLDVTGAPATLTFGPVAGRVRLWLPAYGQIRVQGLDLEDDARVVADPPDAPRWVHYGSSISQGRGAASPARTWPALVARRGLDLTNLAVGAGAHAQPLFAQLVRDRPADVISACLGINVQALGSLTAETFLAAVIGFTRTVRERHPTTALLLVSTVHAPDREGDVGPSGLTLADCRDLLRQATTLLRDHGDRHLHHLHGPDLFGPDDPYLETPGEAERLHPSPAGHDVLAGRFAAVLRGLVWFAPEHLADPVGAGNPHKFAAG